MSYAHQQLLGVRRRNGSDGGADAPMLARVRAQLDRTLREQLQGARQVVLLDYPNHVNVGDAAIWHGERQTLGRLGVRVLLVSDLLRFRPDLVRALPPEVPVLLHGGGNLGDLWPQHQNFRDLVIRTFPERRILVMPQSMHFQDPARRDEVAATMRAHPDLTLLSRETATHAQAGELGLRTVLCPDAAFGIDPVTLPRMAAPPHPVVAMWRKDTESTGAVGDAAGATPVFDWLDERPQGRRRATFKVNGVLRRPALASRAAARAASVALHDDLAAAEVRRGARLIGQGEVFVTDRLHGVVLATLLGKHSVWIDNTYGKIGRVHGTWMADSQLAEQAVDGPAAVARARVLAGVSAGGGPRTPEPW